MYSIYSLCFFPFFLLLCKLFTKTHRIWILKKVDYYYSKLLKCTLHVTPSNSWLIYYLKNKIILIIFKTNKQKLISRACFVHVRAGARYLVFSTDNGSIRGVKGWQFGLCRWQEKGHSWGHLSFVRAQHSHVSSSPGVRFPRTVLTAGC